MSRVTGQRGAGPAMYGDRSPNQGITRQPVGHSSTPAAGSPADGNGITGPGAARAHDGRIAPPNNDTLRSNRGLSGTPPAATDGRIGSGAVPVRPPGNSRGRLDTDDAALYRRSK